MATPNADTVLEFVKSLPEWAYVDRVGVTNCRKISGQQTYSQHSWSNALDIHFTKAFSIPATGSALAAGGRMRSKILAEFGDHVSSLLWQTTDHWDHIHVDFWPKGWLTPPCAGGVQRIKYKDGTVVNGPFPLTIKEEDMPLTDADVKKVADAVIARVPDAVWFRLITNPVTGEQRGAQALLSDTVRYSHSAATRVISTVGASAAQIVAAIKAQWAK